ncbi:MAG: M23 family metallopeptidase [Chitinophagaceae bacterium]|nr:MAG: M23 family metallopeptidase [Chitinophagaceae bacterium]
MRYRNKAFLFTGKRVKFRVEVKGIQYPQNSELHRFWSALRRAFCCFLKNLFMRLIIIVFLLVLIAGCKTAKNGLFKTRSPHEAYADRLKEAKLEATQMGKTWLNGASRALSQPVGVTLPFREQGYFPPDLAHASGYSFSVNKGEEIVVSIKTTPANKVLYFIDLYEKADKLKRVAAADSSLPLMKFYPGKAGVYVLRLQPELLSGMGYIIEIAASPSLAFPVKEEHKPRIISVWGVDRDGGIRSHEGIDIQAPKRTPVVASADGIVTRVGENNLGGKVVFMRPEGKNINLYYAHLDEQLVQSGQRVKAGDVIGLIGNTGNAKNTVPHLHFGIYENGAIDPLPFINPAKKEFLKVAVDTARFNHYARLTPGGTPVKVIGASAGNYKVISNTGAESIVKNSLLTFKPLRTINLKNEVLLTDGRGAIITSFPKGKTVSLVASGERHLFIEADGVHGWIEDADVPSR